MKKEVIIVLISPIVFIILAFILFFLIADMNIINGYYDKEEHFDQEGFRDYNDFRKYYYDDTFDEKYAQRKKYKKVTVTDVENISSYFGDFQRWMESMEKNDFYDFNNSVITEGDYVYINDKSDNSQEDNYDVYLYDHESNILYFIHSNN